MSSTGDSPQSFACPHCGQPNEKPGRQSSGVSWSGASSAEVGTTACSSCGGKLETPAASAPQSPFDDLFDDRGEPKWQERNQGNDGDQLTAEEALQFPEDLDPLALEPAQPLIPLESESPGHFDFPAATAAEATSESSIGEGPPGAGNEATGQPSAANAERGSGLSHELDIELGLQPADLTPAATQSKPNGLSPIFSTGDQDQDDADQPLRIEGFEHTGPPESMTGVRCRICDTLIYVQRNQLGQKVKCPECYSEVLAEEATPRRTASGFSQQVGEEVVWTSEPSRGNSSPESDDEYRLSEPVERPKVEIPSHYGLDAENDDLLAPLSPEVAVGKSTDAKSQPESVPAEREKQPPSGREQSRPTPLPQPGTERWKSGPEIPPPAAGRSAIPQPAATAGGPGRTGSAATSTKPASSTGLPPYWQQKPARPEPASTADDAVTGGALEMELDDLAAPGPAVRQWLTRMASDSRLLVTSGLATAALGIGYWLLGLAGGWLSGEEARTVGTTILSLVVGLPGVVCFLLGMALSAVTAALLFHLGAQKQPQLSAWKGTSYAEWAPAVGFVAFGFWLGVLPGAICGMLLAAVSGAPLWIYALSALSGTLLSPLLLASACRADSPFKLLDSKILQQIRFENVDWLKFLPGSLLSFAIFLVGTLLLLIPGVIGSALGAAGQVAGWIVFGSLTGLYCGLLVEKVNSEEERK